MSTQLSEYLKKFQRYLQDTTSKKECIVEKIRTVVGIELSQKDIKVKNGTLFITTHPSVKSEIFLHKKKLLTYIKEACGTNLIDIR